MVRRPPSTLSWIALGAAALLALVLLCMWAAGATQAIYGVVTLAFQLGVVIAVVAALTDRRGRALGSIALAIVLLVNVGTIGAASAIGAHPGPDAVAGATVDPEDQHWAAYPGIKGQSENEILERMSLEDAVAAGDELMAAIRARLTRDFGFQWVQGIAGTTRKERNGYGGESMLVQYRSGTWATTVPITDYALKLKVMNTIDEVLQDSGFRGAVAFNEPSSGFDPAYIERLYGSTNPRTQPLWSWYSDNEPDPIAFYADISDLTHDDDGTFRAAREAQVAGSSEPIEGLQIDVLVHAVLSETDVEEFQQRMKDY
ncbi:MAG: hypothetical protein ABIR17_10820 [Pseudolysinimonas sp.]|uniref:hypothetical protein n=1 Tax=Pseudolysinimonas sp. TaxID=2680009 RepID=UPI0032659D4F